MIDRGAGAFDADRGDGCTGLGDEIDAGACGELADAHTLGGGDVGDVLRDRKRGDLDGVVAGFAREREGFLV